MKFLNLIYQRIKEFFSKEKPVFIPTKPPVFIPTEPPKVPVDKKVFTYGYVFINSHTTLRPGAINYRGETENSWSTRINLKAVEKLSAKGYSENVFILSRPHDKNYTEQCAYIAEKCRILGITHANSTHFNWGSRKAQGCEFLIPRTLYKSDNKMADFASDALNERLGIFERRVDGVYPIEEGHAGFKMLAALERVGVSAMISEPVFANYRTVESEAIFEHEDYYVDILVDTAIMAIEGKFDC